MPETWQQQYHNRYPGARLVVLGTGPSLAELEPYLRRLMREECTLGVNLLYKWAPIRPYPVTFYGATEFDVLPRIHNYATMHTDANPPRPIARFFTGGTPPDTKIRGYWRWVPRDGERFMGDGWFQGLGDDLDWVAMGWSVVPDLLQVMCWLGFSDILLAGCDFTPQGEVWGEHEAKREPTWNERSRQAMVVANQRITQAGRKLRAVTSTTLEGVERVSPEEIWG